MAREDLPFGAWLKRQRRARGLTQESLAAQIGCAPVTLRKLEAGVRRPSKQVAERLAGALGIPPGEQAAFIAYARAASPGEAGPRPGLAAPNAPAAGPWQSVPAPARRHNLPHLLTRFVDRARETAEIKLMLAQARLVTLTGAGGSGKTRLALHVAEGLAPEFPDGIWWADLARLSDAELVPLAAAASLGLRLEAGRPVLDQVLGYLGPRRLLLLLDNCEHLIGPCAALADACLRAAAGVRILATSREPLAIPGEHVYRVPSLQVPDLGRPPALADLLQVGSVQLFADRAASADANFRVTADNAALVAEICRRLDGMPLAIELAAARVKMLPVAELCARLDDRFRLLTGGSRTALPRHQTLRATLDWGYPLLTEAERAVFRRLAVFAGGWSLEGAEAVCAGEGQEGEVVSLLAGLVDKSMVVLGWQGQAGRYGMLETMRQYAWEKLAGAGEAAAVRGRHLAYYLRLAEDLSTSSRGSEQVLALKRFNLERFDQERDNIRAALGWSLAADPERGLRLASLLVGLAAYRGSAGEDRRWLERLLALNEGAEPRVRAQALLALATVLIFQGELADARPLAEATLALCRELGDAGPIAEALAGLGYIATGCGDWALAREQLEESLAISQAAGGTGGLALPRVHLGIALCHLGEEAQGRALLEECVHQGRRTGQPALTGQAQMMLGFVECEAGEPARARRAFLELLAVASDAGIGPGLLYALDSLGVVAAAEDRHARAARLFGAAQKVSEETQIGLVPYVQSLQERARERARAALGEPEFAALWAEGHAMAPEELLAYATQDEE
jgi:non-specific serine/threonine protein kinase